MDTYNVDPATIGVWRAQAAMGSVIAAAAAAIFLLPQLESAWPFIAIAIAIAGLTLSWIWPSLYYRHLRYGVDDTGIVIQRGVLWRSYIALPRARIQHTDVSQGPLQRRYGVGTLKLYTAGSRHTKIELAGLSHTEAIALRDTLLAGNSASGV
jgi:membrane protein YdbS with pleckstrin-like domain